MTETPKRPETVEEYSAEQLRRRILAVASDLRSYADDVGRLAEYVGDFTREDQRYAFAAQRVLSTVMSALPNLGLDSVVSLAAQADVARAQARTAEKIANAVAAAPPSSDAAEIARKHADN